MIRVYENGVCGLECVVAVGVCDLCDGQWTDPHVVGNFCDISAAVLLRFSNELSAQIVVVNCSVLNFPRIVIKAPWASPSATPNSLRERGIFRIVPTDDIRALSYTLFLGFSHNSPSYFHPHAYLPYLQNSHPTWTPPQSSFLTCGHFLNTSLALRLFISLTNFVTLYFGTDWTRCIFLPTVNTHFSQSWTPNFLNCEHRILSNREHFFR